MQARYKRLCEWLRGIFTPFQPTAILTREGQGPSCGLWDLGVLKVGDKVTWCTTSHFHTYEVVYDGNVFLDALTVMAWVNKVRVL